jgi:hypothetical protein
VSRHVDIPLGVRRGGGCICGKAHAGRTIVAEGTCLWCGRGTCSGGTIDGGRKRDRPVRLRRLPSDLGQVAREGRRPDPLLDNVVQLDDWRQWWKVPRVDERQDVAA